MAVLLNGHKLYPGKDCFDGRYPDGTFSIRVPEDCIRLNVPNIITWKYEYGEEEFVFAAYLSMFLRQQRGIMDIALVLPYIPNARLDRVGSSNEVFTLKYFAEIVNALGFNRVFVLDPHSSVATALLDRVCVLDVAPYITQAIDEIKDPDLVIFYPDDGAAKRYSGMIPKPYCYGVKHRDWQTGNILDLSIAGDIDLKGKNVLIVDDICSRGGTAYYSALALKKAGAEDVYCYFTHCEDTIFSGKLLTTPHLISGVFTTDSIYHGVNPLVTVYPVREIEVSPNHAS